MLLLNKQQPIFRSPINR